MITDDLQESLRSLANRDLLPYVMSMHTKYDPLWYHRKIAAALEALQRGDINKLIIMAPPQHGKSQLSSFDFPSWCLGKNKDEKIIMGSYASEVAEKFGRSVRNSFSDPVFQAIFPGVTLSEDSKAVNRFNTNGEGYYIATGRDGSVTSYACDLLILDDMFKGDGEAKSETIREKVWTTYNSVYCTRLHSKSRQVMFMTRWHDDDLIGRVLATEEKDWVVLKFPAIAEEDEQYRKKGEALWPERFPVSLLDAVKKKDPTLFYCMYQQNPVNEENAEFKKDWFRYFRDDECPGNLRIFTTVDPAISKKASADDSCVMTVGVTPDNVKFILEYTNAKLNPSELIEEIFRHYVKYNPVQVGIETVAYQEALSHFLKIEMKKRNVFMRIEEIRTKEDKESKIRGLIPHYQNGVIYHRAGFCDTLEQQLLRFPKSAHDDVMDSLAMQLQLWNAPLHKTEIGQKSIIKTRSQLIKETLLMNK